MTIPETPPGAGHTDLEVELALKVSDLREALRETLTILNNTEATNWERKQAASLVIATALGDTDAG